MVLPFSPLPLPLTGRTTESTSLTPQVLCSRDIHVIGESRGGGAS